MSRIPTLLFITSTAIIPALVIWAAFLRVGHLAYASFQMMSAGTIILGAAATLLCPRGRYVMAGLATVVLTRFAGLWIDHPTHSLLPPAFIGMSIGLSIRMAKAAQWRRVWPTTGIAVMLLLLVALAVRAFMTYYGADWFEDRSITPAVSANYATYLALLIVTNLVAPATFVLVDRLHSANESRRPSTMGIAWGASVGAVVHLVFIWLQAAGWTRLASGANDEWEVAGRSPGLLTDSGSASLLTPALLFLIAISLHRAWKCRRAYHAHPLLFDALLLFAFVIATLSCLPFLGRTFLLNSAASLTTLLIYIAWNKTRLQRKRFAIYLLAPGFIVVLFTAAILVANAEHIPPLAYINQNLETVRSLHATGSWWDVALAIDHQRAYHLERLIILIKEAPWIGHGIGSFQVKLTQMENPAGMIIDNPPNLLLGLWSDVGAFGLLLVGLSWALWLRIRPQGLLLLPLTLLPGFLIGYHLIFPELCTLLVIPLAGARTPHKRPGAAAAFVATLLIIYAIQTITLAT